MHRSRAPIACALNWKRVPVAQQREIQLERRGKDPDSALSFSSRIGGHSTTSNANGFGACGSVSGALGVEHAVAAINATVLATDSTDLPIRRDASIIPIPGPPVYHAFS